MRSRDLDRLAADIHDVLIVGGGIQGLTIAYETASRGLTAALLESHDFGSGTSFNHQKTAHGGLRSLQSGRLDRAHQAICERRALARIAPSLLRPLPFIVGTYRSFTRGRLALRAAFRIDRWLGRKRNEGVEPELHLPAPRLVSRAATLHLFRGIREDGLTGGAQWYDYQMVEADRLTFAFAAAADRAGAVLANYVEALEPVRDGNQIAGFVARDQLTGESFTVRARAIVNAAGPHAGTLMRRLGVTREFLLLKAMNLVTSKRASDIALAAPSAAGRMLTLVPWHGHALIGTSQSASFVEPDDTGVSLAEVHGFIAEVNYAFPALKLSLEDIRLVHRGIVPALRSRDGQPELRSMPEIYDHASEGAEGAFTAVGVKYTTARAVAERTAHLVARRLGKRLKPSATAVQTLPGAGIADHEALAIETARAIGIELSTPTIRHLIERYAEGAADIVRLAAGRPELLEPVAGGVPTIRAEVVNAIRAEMAMRLGDIVIRRTGLGASGYPGDEAVRACGDLAAAEADWDAERTAAEVSAVQAFYRMVREA